MKFASLRTPAGRSLGVVHADGQRVLDLSRLGHPDVAADLDALVAAGDEGLARVTEAVQGADATLWTAFDETALAPPLLRPGKIMALGLNYSEHAEEQNLAPPPVPVLFAKFPSAIIGPGDAIRIPALSDKIDHEVELAVIIGRRGRHISEAEARNHVFGYTVLNDVTARDLQKSDRQWVRAKSFDTFCPMGPLVVTVDEFEFPPRRAIRLRVNGQERQSSNTSCMNYNVPALIHHLSQAFTLETGDVIATGTPAGVGVYRTPPVFLRPGDVVEAEIEGIGTLINPVAQSGD